MNSWTKGHANPSAIRRRLEKLKEQEREALRKGREEFLRRDAERYPNGWKLPR